MAEEFVIKLIPEGSSVSQTGGGQSSGGISGLGLGLAAGGGMGIALEVINLLKDALLDVLSPVVNLLKGLLKLVAELLRPIAEVLIMIIKPVFEMLRPLISMFKTFMQPFMQIARQYSAMVSAQMATGDTTGAISTSMEGIKTLLMPFAVSFASVTSQFLVEILGGALNALIQSILSGLQMVVGSMGFPGAVAAIEQLKVNVQDGISTTTNVINDRIIELTVNILKNMQETSQEKLDTFKKSFALGLENGMVNPADAALQSMSKNTDALFNVETGTIVTTFVDGLGELTSSTNSFVEKLKAAAETINNISISIKKSKNDDTNNKGYMGGVVGVILQATGADKYIPRTI